MSEVAALRARLREARRVVVKVGSAVLCDDHLGGLAEPVLDELSRSIARLHEGGVRTVVVSSGAIALGMQELGLAQRPASVEQRQALAAIGQGLLMQAWREALGRRRLRAAQVLLTHADLRDRRRYLNARHALRAMLDYDVVPVVNENDTVAVEEICFGDNDVLSAQVAILIGADLLVLLSTCDGLHDTDPTQVAGARRIPFVPRVDASTRQLASTQTSRWGVGGMRTKLEAAHIAATGGVPSVVAAGKTPEVLEAIVAGRDVGTLFAPEPTPLRSRKHWIAHTLRPSGTLVVDAGAAAAIVAGGSSLLPSGITAVRGRFDVGDAVDIVDPVGRRLARGLVAYDSEQIQRIAGHRSADIATILGYRYSDEVVHRDDLVVVER